MSQEIEEENMAFKNVYHSLESVLKMLRSPQFCELPEVQELLTIFYNVTGNAYTTLNEVPEEANKLIKVIPLNITDKATNSKVIHKAINSKITDKAVHSKVTSGANNSKVTDEANNSKVTDEANNSKVTDEAINAADGPFNFDRKPFIVFEGLDASGKSRIGREVASIFGAVLMSTPPKCLQDIRYKFDSRSETLRRAYYALGNYIAGWEVEILIKTKPVFMDRFWHSTTAYTVAQEISQGNLSLPNLGDPIYMWPKDLVRPNKVFFLEVDEETRNKRMARRRQTVTSEELQLKDSNTFRTSLVETYKRMMVPSIIQVDANRKVAEVVQEVASTLKPLFPDRKIESIMK